MVHKFHPNSLSLSPPLPQHVLPSEQEAVYVKESLARITVETVKRMWPQHWPTFLSGLDSLTHCGVSELLSNQMSS